MSGVKQLQIITRLFLSVAASIIGWVAIAPITALIPKRRDWIAVIGRQNGYFLDNAKYFFLQARQTAPNLRIEFLTEDAATQKLINSVTIGALRFPSMKAAWFLARCGSAIVDEAAWFRKFRAFFLIRANVIQLWHGVGCKWIEKDLWCHEAGDTKWASRHEALRLRLLAYKVTRRRVCYAIVATTSQFYRDEVFKPAFVAKHFLIVGYPRNDFGQSLQGKFKELAWKNIDADIRKKCEDWLQRGRKLVLVAPTFRDSGSAPMQLGGNTIKAIDAFAAQHAVEFIFKFHPSERNVSHLAGRHLHVCAHNSDIYPLMPQLSALVTDYSSISMDFLLVDRPLIFLIPKDDNYLQEDRQLQFDPKTMMPGPIVPDWASLLDALQSQWEFDRYKPERAELRRKAFDNLPQAEAVPELLRFMREQGWVLNSVQPDRR